MRAAQIPRGGETIVVAPMHGNGISLLSLFGLDAVRKIDVQEIEPIASVGLDPLGEVGVDNFFLRTATPEFLYLQTGGFGATPSISLGNPDYRGEHAFLKQRFVAPFLYFFVDEYTIRDP
jgi:hypothetical protein